MRGFGQGRCEGCNLRGKRIEGEGRQPGIRFEQVDDPDGSGCIRRKIVLVSLNPEYEDIEIRANVPFRIVGQVLN